MYSVINFKTKKDLKTAVAAANAGEGPPVRIFAPVLGQPKENGMETLEGPHYPKPHSWYAQVEMKDGQVVRVK